MNTDSSSYLPLDTGAQLAGASATGRADVAEGGAVHVQVHAAEVVVVEDVEQFHTQLDGGGFGQAEPLQDGHVLAEVPGGADLGEAVRGRAEGLRGGVGEGGLVEH